MTSNDPIDPNEAEITLMGTFLSAAAPESVQIGKEYLCTKNNCNDLTGDSIDLSPPNPSGTSGPVDPDRLGFNHINFFDSYNMNHIL